MPPAARSLPALTAAVFALAACGGPRAAPAPSSTATTATTFSSSGASEPSAPTHGAATDPGAIAATDAPPPSSSFASTEPAGELAPEFPTTSASRWLNGAPFTLASARGDVVLVEAWHRL